MDYKIIFLPGKDDKMMRNLREDKIRRNWTKILLSSQDARGDKRKQKERRRKERRVRQIPIDFSERRLKSERRAFDRRASLPVGIFYRVTKPILRAILYLFWIKEVKGIENMPRSDSAIIAVNHCSYLDFFIISAAIRRRLYFLAAQELHRVSFLRWFMRYNERIYLDRERPGVRYFREVVRILQQKKLVVLFPEGTRSKDGKIHRGKLGFVKLAIVARVPIIPIAISGTFDIYSKRVRFPRLSHSCKVHVGEPVFLNQYFGKKTSRNVLQKIADDIMGRISKLSGISKAFFPNRSRSIKQSRGY